MRTTRNRISIVACIAALVTAFVVPAAHATPRPVLPTVGSVVTLTLSAPGVELSMGDEAMTTDLAGDVVLRVVAGDADPLSSVQLRVLDLSLTGTVPDGTVDIALDAVDRAALGKLTMTPDIPPTVEHLLSLGFQFTLTRPGHRTDPLVLSTKDPAKLIASLTTFPPQGDVYQLQNPIDLIGPDDPSTVVATIEKFPVTVGGL